MVTTPDELRHYQNRWKDFGSEAAFLAAVDRVRLVESRPDTGEGDLFEMPVAGRLTEFKLLERYGVQIVDQDGILCGQLTD